MSAKDIAMRELIIRKFIKDHENTGDPRVRESYGKLAGAVGIISNAVLCALKIMTGILTGSIAILSDGINNLSDASASLITLIGFKLSGKAPDKDHPYGHGRSEYLAGLAVSVMILFIGISLLRSAIEKTIHPEALEFSWISVVILVVSILAKLWQMSFNRSVGKRIDSEALLATAADSRNDVISTSAVLVSVIIGRLTSLKTDGPVGILVSLFIIWSGFSLIKESLSPILGQNPDPGLTDRIKKILLSDERVIGIHDLIIHDYGPGRIFASVHAEVDATGEIMATHDLIDNLERDVYNDCHVLLTIHMDPLDVNDPLTATVNAQIKDIVADLDYVVSFHDVRVVAGPTHDNVLFDVVISPDCRLPEKEVRDLIAGRLTALNEKYRAVITVDRSYA